MTIVSNNMADDSLYAAVAALLKPLANSTDSTATIVASRDAADNVSLPGRDSAERRYLESEISSLIRRIHQLESRAVYNITSTPFPDTPNEASDSLFGDDAVNTTTVNGLAINGSAPLAATARINHALSSSDSNRSSFTDDRLPATATDRKSVV